MGMKMKKVENTVIAFACFLFVISFSVVVTLNFKPLYYMDVEILNLVESSGYSKETIIENYDALIDYNSMFNFGELEFDGLKMSNEGRIHFEEVKEIFVGLQILMIITGVLAFIGIFYKVRKKDFAFFKLASIFTIVIPTVLGTLIGINWDWCFITFHQLAFDNDYWIFSPYEDEIINILPDEFFMHSAIMIVAIAFILAIAMMLVYKKCSKKN